MTSYKFHIPAIALICFLGLISCSSEKKIVESDIVGRWEVYQAERGGKPTQTVNGAYFEFMPENQLYTNILGEGMMTGYNIYNNVIVQQGGQKVRYAIEALNEEKMTLSAEINGVDFVLDLVKTSTL